MLGKGETLSSQTSLDVMRYLQSVKMHLFSLANSGKNVEVDVVRSVAHIAEMRVSIGSLGY